VNTPLLDRPLVLLGLMLADKKNGADGLTLILARGIGRAFVSEGFPVERVREFLTRRP